MERKTLENSASLASCLISEEKAKNMRQKIGWRRKLAVKAAIDRHEDFQHFAGFRLRKLPSDCLAIHRLLYHC
jgi:hypothetical protein